LVHPKGGGKGEPWFTLPWFPLPWFPLLVPPLGSPLGKIDHFPPFFHLPSRMISPVFFRQSSQTPSSYSFFRKMSTSTSNKISLKKAKAPATAPTPTPTPTPTTTPADDAPHAEAEHSPLPDKKDEDDDDVDASVLARKKIVEMSRLAKLNRANTTTTAEAEAEAEAESQAKEQARLDFAKKSKSINLLSHQLADVILAKFLGTDHAQDLKHSIDEYGVPPKGFTPDSNSTLARAIASGEGFCNASSFHPPGATDRDGRRINSNHIYWAGYDQLDPLPDADISFDQLREFIRNHKGNSYIDGHVVRIRPTNEHAYPIISLVYGAKPKHPHEDPLKTFRQRGISPLLDILAKYLEPIGISVLCNYYGKSHGNSIEAVWDFDAFAKKQLNLKYKLRGGGLPPHPHLGDNASSSSRAPPPSSSSTTRAPPPSSRAPPPSSSSTTRAPPPSSRVPPSTSTTRAPPSTSTTRAPPSTRVPHPSSTTTASAPPQDDTSLGSELFDIRSLLEPEA